MANRIDLSNILINFLKKARYERHIEEGTLEENQFYAVTDGNEKTEYGDLFGNIENQADLYNALYASRLFKMEMCNDARGYDIVHKLYDRREFDLSKFTVVGNPVISKDGIASGFSNKNYVTSKYNLEDEKTYTFIVEGVGGTPRTDRGSYVFVAYYNKGGFDNLRLITGVNNGIVRFALGNIPDVTTKFAILNGVKYKIELKTDFKTFVTFTDLLTGYTLTKTGYLITNQFYGDNIITYGTAKRVSPLTNGSIDFKYFSIIVDGEEVFNGIKDLTQYDTYTLPSSEVITIPYIPSVDGVKIVDVAYKPLVDQLYTETGMGNYIIIDETNKTFRLPLPDIYSQIENKTSFTLRKWED